MNKKINKKAIEAISKSQGRFFGLTTKQGETMNAQFVAQTKHYITLWERNKKAYKKIAKTSVNKVSIAGQTI